MTSDKKIIAIRRYALSRFYFVTRVPVKILAKPDKTHKQAVFTDLTCIQLYKVQQFRCYRSGLRHLLGEHGGIEADRQTNSSRQQAAADS
jgi:hypothetical protein